MSFIIPNQQSKKIRQLNINELFGEIFASKNIDLGEQGLIKLSHGAIATMTTDNDSAFSTADSMFRNKDELYLLSTELFNSGKARTVSVGDRTGGGIVVYILQPGDTGYDASKQKGLIISEENINSGSSIYWHTSATGTTGATGTALGTGQSNTTAILALYGTEGNAAKLCDDYSNISFSDWYLPSRDELLKVYTNFNQLQFTGNLALWSSSEIDDAHAFLVIVSTGAAQSQGKNNYFYVRAMRNFEVTQELTSNYVTLDPFYSRTDKGDTDAPTPNQYQDGIHFNNTDVVSDGNSIFYRSFTTKWQSLNLSLDIRYPTCFGIFDTYNSLLVGNKNKVYMVDTNWVTVKTLVLPAQYSIMSIAVNGNTAGIVTKNNDGGEAMLFTWDGTNTAFNTPYGVGTFEAPIIRKYNGSFALLTSRGQLLQFNGGGFSELASFPVFYYEKDWGNVLAFYSKASNRGMVVDESTIYIRLDSNISGNNPYNNYFPGGTWVYTPETGLNCIHTPSFSKVLQNTVATSAVNTTTDIITSTNVPITGTPVIYTNGGGTTISGLKNNKLYFTIKISSTEFKLAETLVDALAGTAIDLTGTGNNAQVFNFILVNDYGFAYSNNYGSIELLPLSVAPNDLLTDRLVFTADLFSKTDVSTKKTVFNIINPQLPNRGYFITPKLNSPNLEDTYNEIWIKYRPLKTDDKIVIKFKTLDKQNIPFGSLDDGMAVVGTWVDTNTFTTTLDMSDASVGDEIEIIAGVGAGVLAHIESLSENAGTWTVNLTESFIFASANDVMYFYVDNWTILDTITPSNQTGYEYYQKSIDKNSKFLQLKIELRGVDVTIEEFKITSGKLVN